MQGQTRKQTIKALCSFLMFLGWQISFAQLIYFNTAFDIYSFDPLTCEYTFVIRAQRSSTDIAFDRNGNFYGCNTDLNRIYLSTGSVSKIAEIGDRALNGMTISNDDIVYMGDLGGELISYNLNTQVVRHHGNIGYDCAGDLTFYKGELYMAARDNKIIKVNIEQPELSELVLTYSSSFEILGIVSDYRGCDDTRVYGLTGDSSEVLLIDFENLTGEFVCQLPFNVYGGASTSEFLASIPVTLGPPVVVQPDCKSLTGSVTFPNPSGMGKLEFRLGTNAWQAETDFSNLTAGVYSFYLRDEEACMDSLQIELKPYPLLNMNSILVTPASCTQSDGELLVQASGGTGVLTYSLNGILFQLNSQFPGLAAGTYEVYVKDNSGCTISQNVEVSIAGLVDVHNYEVVNSSCGKDNGTISFFPDELDISQYTFAMYGGTFQDGNIFTELAEGLYQIIVRHQDGCQDTVTIPVGSTDAPELILASTTPERCSLRNGLIEVTVTKGLPPYLFSLNNGAWQPGQTFAQLQSGSYFIFVEDAVGCTDSIDVIVEFVEGPEILTLTTYPAECNSENGSLDIEWNNPDGSTRMTILDERMDQVYDLSLLMAGEYKIALADSSGCKFDTLVLIGSKGCELAIPNVFSPNGDGVNDEFEVLLQPNDQRRIVSLEIFDRWGNQVYMSPGSIDPYVAISWDGLFNGSKCLPGVYTYILILMQSDQSQANLFGDITLIR